MQIPGNSTGVATNRNIMSTSGLELRQFFHSAVITCTISLCRFNPSTSVYRISSREVSADNTALHRQASSNSRILLDVLWLSRPGIGLRSLCTGIERLIHLAISHTNVERPSWSSLDKCLVISVHYVALTGSFLKLSDQGIALFYKPKHLCRYNPIYLALPYRLM